MTITTKNIVISTGVSDKIRNDLGFRGFINKSIGRHFKFDFGDMDEHDKEVNLKNARTGGRVLSVYTYSDNSKIYIITESDRSLTNIILTEEY